MRYGDLHCDTLTSGGKQPFLHRKNTQISLEKLIGGDCFLQCFAVFCRSKEAGAWRRACGFVSDFRGAEAELRSAGIIPVLTIEDGGILEGELSRLDFLTAAGVRIFGFTWNDENCLGYPCGASGGLKPFGRQAAEKLFSEGVYADVSHLSDGGTEELISLAKAFGRPIVASHSLCRAVYAHKRNLTDGQIRGIADTGGVVGVNFVREFIGPEGLFGHIRRLIAVGGEDVAAIGTDFDGTEAPLYAGADEMPKFFDDMKKAGFSFRQTEKLAYKNVARLII